MEKKLNLICALILLYSIFSQNVPAQRHLELALYSHNKNDASGKNNDPMINVFLPKTSNGLAVIACPGGGYSGLQIENEGNSFAPYFNEQGIALIVLKYRLPNGLHDIPLADAERAMRLIKENAREWNINTQMTGIMGASAGGHLASTLATHFSVDTRPCFQILLYPVITMKSDFTNVGSRIALLGEQPVDKLIEFYSNELQVTAGTPQAFIVLCDNDKVVSPQNSIRYYQALQKNGVQTELHIYPTGGHGWGISNGFKYKAQWTDALKFWLTEIRNQSLSE
jgi:acetyl esterase/lipase